MKRLLLIATALLALTAPANADSLPDAYLGRWCFNGNGYKSVDSEAEWKACLAGDGYMEIKRDGWVGHEETCKFISIKNTSEKIPRENEVGRDIWKGSWRPIIYVTARCRFFEDPPWNVRLKIRWFRGGGFSMTEK